MALRSSLSVSAMSLYAPLLYLSYIPVPVVKSPLETNREADGPSMNAFAKLVSPQKTRARDDDVVCTRVQFKAGAKRA